MNVHVLPMKYTGRISILSLFLIVIAIYIWICGEVKTLHIVVSLVVAPVFWYIGKVYDKSIFYSYNDYLTGIYNRRYCYTIIPKLLCRAKLNRESIAFFNIDINNFKRINDTHGHEFGDIVLKRISSILFKNISKKDVLIRWGGDEFLIISPNTNKAVAKGLSQQLHERVQIEMKDIQNNIQCDINISIGISTYPEDGQTFDQLLVIADQKMYKNKASIKR